LYRREGLISKDAWFGRWTHAVIVCLGSVS